MSLSVDSLDVSISGLRVLHGASLRVPAGGMVGLVGHNGAGKTTLMHAVMGLLRCDRGRVRIGDLAIEGLPAHRRAALGIGFMPETRRLVPQLTAEENILLPAWAGHVDAPAERLRWIYSRMPELVELAPRKALALSGGQQKLVALARALMPGRRLILLDEPFEGVAPALAQRLAEVISALRADGMSALLSESDDVHSRRLVDQVYRIERGVVQAPGGPARAAS